MVDSASCELFAKCTGCVFCRVVRSKERGIMVLRCLDPFHVVDDQLGDGIAVGDAVDCYVA